MTDYFTPVAGLIGGSLIGLSAGTLLLFNGDILGASGVMSSIFTAPYKTLQDTTQFWKLVLLSSFLVASTYLLGPRFLVDERSQNDASVTRPSEIAYVIAGLLVGFGTNLGNGCTSGHGVCGLGRQSYRSFAGVLTFMTFSIATVTLTCSESYMSTYTQFLRRDMGGTVDRSLGANFTMAIVTLTAVSYRISQRKFLDEDKSKILPAAVVGIMFASGLAISHMVLGSKLFGFLDVTSMSWGQWDPTLAMVMGGAVVISTIAYQFVQGYSCTNHKKVLMAPLMAPKFAVPSNTMIDTQLLLGTALFGMGWGIGLLCPAPALYHAANGNPDVLFRWIPAFVAGSYTAQYFKR